MLASFVSNNFYSCEGNKLVPPASHLFLNTTNINSVSNQFHLLFNASIFPSLVPPDLMIIRAVGGLGNQFI